MTGTGPSCPPPATTAGAEAGAETGAGAGAATGAGGAATAVDACATAGLACRTRRRRAAGPAVPYPTSTLPEYSDETADAASP